MDKGGNNENNQEKGLKNCFVFNYDVLLSGIDNTIKLKVYGLKYMTNYNFNNDTYKAANKKAGMLESFCTYIVCN